MLATIIVYHPEEVGNTDATQDQLDYVLEHKLIHKTIMEDVEGIYLEDVEGRSIYLDNGDMYVDGEFHDNKMLLECDRIKIGYDLIEILEAYDDGLKVVVEIFVN